MRVRRGVVLVAALGAAAVGSVTLPADPAQSAEGRCAAGTGVTVVVDYGDLADYTELGCDAAGANVAAKTVMPRAGFPFEYVNNQAFVCRVKGLPDTSSESCGDTPPAHAYWGLFWSDGKSTSWKYSNSGVNDLKVPEGGSIGWRFQDGGALDYPDQPPTLTPAKPKPSPSPSKTPAPQPPPPTKGPAPTPEPPTTSAPPGTEGPRPSQSSSGAPSETADGGADDGGSSAPGGAGKGEGRGPERKGDQAQGNDRSSSKSKRGDSTTSTESSVDDSEIVAIEPASGEPLTQEESSTGLTLLAGATVLVLGAAAGVIAWRRRV